MKKYCLLSLIFISLFACNKKEEASPLVKVKFSVTGTSVNEFKFNTEGLSASTHVAVPFSGTKDTTVYVGAAKVLSLDSKADAASGSTLVGNIYVNDQLVNTLTDADLDKDGKTQIKLSYTIPGQ